MYYVKNTRASQKFSNILVYASSWHIMCPKQFKLASIPAVVFSLMVIGALIQSGLLHLMWDLKAAQMNVPCSLNLETYSLWAQS